jgi:hypothetical protein
MSLVDTLRTIGTPVCLGAASRLETTGHPCGTYTLHLRNAGLGRAEASLIATAIEHASDQGAQLLSFSLSHNPAVTDAAIERLVCAFPASITEVGLVDCALGDIAGQALIIWAKAAPALRMLCVERNRFSPDIREALIALGQDRSGPLVVV